MHLPGKWLFIDDIYVSQMADCSSNAHVTLTKMLDPFIPTFFLFVAKLLYTEAFDAMLV